MVTILNKDLFQFQIKLCSLTAKCDSFLLTLMETWNKFCTLKSTYLSCSRWEIHIAKGFYTGNPNFNPHWNHKAIMLPFLCLKEKKIFLKRRWEAEALFLVQYTFVWRVKGELYIKRRKFNFKGCLEAIRPDPRTL